MMRALILAALLAAAPAAAQLSVEKPADLALPVTLQPGQGALVIGWRRPDGWSLGKSGIIAFARYDVAKRDMIARPKDAKKLGDTNTYWIQARSKDRKAAHELAVMVVSAGDYVLYGAMPGPAAQVMNTFCFESVMVGVKAGEVVYFGDFTPYIGAKAEDGRVISAMAWSSHPEEAKAALASQPVLAAAFRVGEVKGGASYSCAGQVMAAYRPAGVPMLPDLTAEEKAALAKDAPVAAPRQAAPNQTGVPILIPSG